MKIVELKQEILRENEITADEIREEMRKAGKLLINVMSSPGSGKTTTLCQLIKALQPEFRVGVMECDIDASVDAETVESAGAKSIQLHTGGMCHMDAAMTKHGLDELGIYADVDSDTGEEVDIIFIENVGNLVCPAEFDTGAQVNITILSIPEGDDKPAKYPLVYEVCDAVVINKTDALAVFDFDMELAAKRIHACNPDSVIIPVSAKTGAGIDVLADYIRGKMPNAKGDRPLPKMRRGTDPY